jgi:hypothetical protein
MIFSISGDLKATGLRANINYLLNLKSFWKEKIAFSFQTINFIDCFL